MSISVDATDDAGADDADDYENCQHVLVRPAGDGDNLEPSVSN